MTRDYSKEGLTLNVIDKKIRWGITQPMVDHESLSPPINDDVLRAVAALMRETWREFYLAHKTEHPAPPPYMIANMGARGTLRWYPPDAEHLTSYITHDFNVSPAPSAEDYKIEVHELRSMIEALQTMVQMVGIGDMPVGLRSTLVSVLKTYTAKYPTNLGDEDASV